eukprot:7049729-Alexandrium_andersonii.AAC.1
MSRVDHLPSITQVAVDPARFPKWHLRKPVCDGRALADPKVLEALAASLEAIPPVPWQLDMGAR